MSLYILKEVLSEDDPSVHKQNGAFGRVWRGLRDDSRLRRMK